VTREGELVRGIAKAVASAVEGEWVAVRYSVTALSGYAEELCHVTRPTGEVVQQLPPRTVAGLANELRDEMYRPGAGTWFSADITVSHKPEGGAKVDATFDSDVEPAWAVPPGPGMYRQELERLPRDPEHIPSWLRRRLEQA